MSRANYMLLIFSLNFGEGLCGDEWPEFVTCPTGKEEGTFQWTRRDIPLDGLVIPEEDTTESPTERSDFADLTFSHENLYRDSNCDPPAPGLSTNLCDDYDEEMCALGKTSLCVRSATRTLPLFKDPLDLFATHDYHCDDKGNEFYYALTLYRVHEGTDVSELPPNFEPDISLISVSTGHVMTAGFYLFHYLPNLLKDGYLYFAVGYVYGKVSAVTSVTGALSRNNTFTPRPTYLN